MPALRTPATRRTTDEGDSAGLISLFTQVADWWELTVDERLTLLGGISRTTHFEWTHERPPRSLSIDQRQRIAHVVGIDVATHQFFGVRSENARTYVRRPRTAPDGEHTALQVMLTGLPGLASVRHHLEVLCGGSAASLSRDRQ